MNRTYLCIDLKTFYASVECVERGLDPFTTNLVVADPTRGKGTICLAVSPRMKELGVKNRCRIFDIPTNIDYIKAMPRMNLYIQYSANIYAIYLKYIAKEDIHVYSIDEAFMDVTKYLKMYNMSAVQLAEKIMKDIYDTYGITATAGIGTNLYLCKVALDITAKHVKSHIGILDEETYKKTLWNHTPLTDFWQIGRGIAKRLDYLGIRDMEGIAKADPKTLYKEFGINAEFLIDHANGKEPTTIAQIKAYKSKENSISNGQVLFEDYDYEKARLIVKEMVELSCLELSDKHLVSSHISLSIGYSKDLHKPTGGSLTLTNLTNSFEYFLPYFLAIFDKTTIVNTPIRRINVGFSDVRDEIYEQYDLFTDPTEYKKDEQLQKTINKIKKKYGKNSVLRGMNLLEGATTIKRNKLVGGHNGD
jgi:DNA polymerase V